MDSPPHIPTDAADAKKRDSDRRLHQRNGCWSRLKKSETNILMVPDPLPKKSSEIVSSPSSQKEMPESHRTQKTIVLGHRLEVAVQDHLLCLDLSLTNSSFPKQSTPSP